VEKRSHTVVAANRPTLEQRGVGPSCSIVLFDGECNLCHASLGFIIARDARKQFRFASLQSSIGNRLLGQYGLSGEKQDAVVLIDGKRAFTRSAAALRIACRLRWPCPFLFTLIVFPPFVRDFFFARIARDRYRWFGRRPSCRAPGPELRDRFLDDVGHLP
jgi:predicted DCC family thiol-disulfide oxidoreductase YuxK